MKGFLEVIGHKEVMPPAVKRKRYAINEKRTLIVINGFRYSPNVRFLYYKLNGFDFLLPLQMWIAFSGMRRQTLVNRLKDGLPIGVALGYEEFIKKKPGFKKK